MKSINKEKNAIHRDLKLANIILQFKDHHLLQKDLLKNLILKSDFTKDNIMVKIADLGLARTLEVSEGDATTLCGTPSLMAPEVILLRPYDEKCDVWSLGCLFYEIMFGFKPFQGKSQDQIF